MGKQLLRSLYHSIVYNAVHRRELKRPSRMTFNSLELVVEANVHHPGIFKSGKVFAGMLSRIDLYKKAVLDMGTGSGILALTAAHQGADVVAVDKDPAAVQCSTANVRRNGLEMNVRVLNGDLFSTIPDRTFDVILFNPPYFTEQTGSFRDTALYGGNNLEIIKDFADSAANHLTAGGYVLMIISTDSDVGRCLQIFRVLNYTSVLLETRETIFETFYIYKFAPFPTTLKAHSLKTTQTITPREPLDFESSNGNSRFVCPSCRGSLHRSVDTWECPRESFIFPAVAGIPILLFRPEENTSANSLESIRMSERLRNGVTGAPNSSSVCLTKTKQESTQAIGISGLGRTNVSLRIFGRSLPNRPAFLTLAPAIAGFPCVSGTRSIT